MKYRVIVKYRDQAEQIDCLSKDLARALYYANSLIARGRSYYAIDYLRVEDTDGVIYLKWEV